MRIGVDLGGTKIEAVVLGDQGEIVTRRRRPTPRESYADTLQAIVRLGDEHLVQPHPGATFIRPDGSSLD